ncbi:MAG: M48 family metalloprotease [Desulfovibrio sp.]
MKVLVLSLLYFLLTIMPAQANQFFGPVTIADEMEMGREVDQKIMKSGAVTTDPEINKYVVDVVTKLVENKPKMPFPIKVRVISNRAMNAFAVPGGYIYIFTGLILGVQNEGQFAAVVAHELAHASQRHVAKRMEKMKKTQVLSTIATIGGVALGMSGAGADAGKALVIGSQAAAQTAFLDYTRTNERDADHVGLTNLIAAGYNPEDMPATFEVMKTKSGRMPSDYPTYLSTHPGLNERISYLKGRILRMPPEILTRTTDNTEFKRAQTIIRAIYPDAEVALGYYTNLAENKYSGMDYLGKAVLLQRLKKYDDAEIAALKAVDRLPHDYMVQREAGIIYYKTKQYDKAAIHFQKASLFNPRDGETLYYLAMMFQQQGQHKQAMQTMKSAQEASPTLSMIRLAYGRMLGKDKQFFAAHLQLAYGYFYQRDAKKFSISKKKLQALAKTEEEKEELKQLITTTQGFGKNRR